MALSICNCGKHVRARESVCPFCGARRGDRARVARAVLFAGLAVTSAASVACYGGPPPHPENPPPTSSSPDGGGNVP